MVALNIQGLHAQSAIPSILKIRKEVVILKTATIGSMENVLCAQMGTEKKANNVLN